MHCLTGDGLSENILHPIISLPPLLALLQSTFPLRLYFAMPLHSLSFFFNVAVYIYIHLVEAHNTAWPLEWKLLLALISCIHLSSNIVQCIFILPKHPQLFAFRVLLSLILPWQASSFLHPVVVPVLPSIVLLFRGSEGCCTLVLHD